MMGPELKIDGGSEEAGRGSGGPPGAAAEAAAKVATAAVAAAITSLVSSRGLGPLAAVVAGFVEGRYVPELTADLADEARARVSAGEPVARVAERLVAELLREGGEAPALPAGMTGQGEVAEVAGDSVVCWFTTGAGVRVKTDVPRSAFGNHAIGQGTRFEVTGGMVTGVRARSEAEAAAAVAAAAEVVTELDRMEAEYRRDRAAGRRRLATGEVDDPLASDGGGGSTVGRTKKGTELVFGPVKMVETVEGVSAAEDDKRPRRGPSVAETIELLRQYDPLKLEQQLADDVMMGRDFEISEFTGPIGGNAALFEHVDLPKTVVRRGDGSGAACEEG